LYEKSLLWLAESLANKKLIGLAGIKYYQQIMAFQFNVAVGETSLWLWLENNVGPHVFKAISRFLKTRNGVPGT
jgi:hypothetical protein